IMENIKKRKYIEIKVKNKDKVIFATDKGMMLVRALSSMSFMKLDYTRIMEEQLDLIAKGEGSYLDLMGEVNGSLDRELMNVVIESQVKKSACPICGLSVKQLKSKKGKGYFWVHEENNDNCEKFLSDKNDIPVKPGSINTKNEPCPKCNEILVQKYSKEKDFHFWVHEAKNTNCEKFIKDEEGLPVIH
ncbi:MAG: DNA topoisomerase, partial [Methylococcales bacterium]